MSKTKKQLLSSAPWRGDHQQQEDKFQDARLRATKRPGSASTMHVPRKKSVKTRPNDKDDDDDQSLSEIDPELRHSFQRLNLLQFYGRVRNLEGPASTQAVENSLRRAKLVRGGVGDKEVSEYTRAEKRRLSVAISLIGNPQLKARYEESSTFRNTTPPHQKVELRHLFGLPTSSGSMEE